MSSNVYETRVYSNRGNPELISLVPKFANRILDVGCGSGDNAKCLASQGREVWGITLSPEEAFLARPFCKDVCVADIEQGLPPSFPELFDCIVLSHVLEHLVRPKKVLAELCTRLTPDGSLLIAVPNMAHWRMRLQFLKGEWTRPDNGPLDSTHLQFWSFDSILELFSALPLKVVSHTGTFAVPLFPLRQIAPSICALLDVSVGPLAPNLFSGQTLVAARRS